MTGGDYIVGKFNSEALEFIVNNFCDMYYLYNLVKNQYLENPNKLVYSELILSNFPKSLIKPQANFINQMDRQHFFHSRFFSILGSLAPMKKGCLRANQKDYMGN